MTLSVSQMLGITAESDRATDWTPHPHQVPPDGDWYVWLLLGGRGSGKTEAGSRYVLDHLRAYGPSARVGIGAPTYGDVRDVCAEGVSGLITIAPNEFDYSRHLSEARHERGGYVKFIGAIDPTRWNGPQWSLLWFDELALCNQNSWEQALFGLRLGRAPRAIATTTPKNRRFIKELSESQNTVTVNATTFDNPALSPLVLERLQTRYGGTRLGRQELLAEFVDDVEGAYWNTGMLDSSRVDPSIITWIPDGTGIQINRIVVAIDPAGTHNKNSNETGIVVAGKGNDGDYYVFHGQGYRLSPEGWANEAVRLYDFWEADRIVAERNQGGEMVASTLNTVRDGLPIKTIQASRGKAVRAEPVAALYEQGRVHHVGVYQDLEEQMCLFPVEHENDDMVDALVYSISELANHGLPDPPLVHSFIRPYTVGPNPLGLDANNPKYWDRE